MDFVGLIQPHISTQHGDDLSLKTTQIEEEVQVHTVHEELNRFTFFKFQSEDLVKLKLQQVHEKLKLANSRFLLGP